MHEDTFQVLSNAVHYLNTEIPGLGQNALVACFVEFFLGWRGRQRREFVDDILHPLMVELEETRLGHGIDSVGLEPTHRRYSG